MRYVKTLGLLGVAAAALMAFAGSASATTLTSPTGTTYTGTIKAASEPDAVAGTNHVLLHNETADIECNSTVEGKVEKHGAGKAVSGKISKLVFNNCTEGWTVHVVSGGELSVTSDGGYNGTLFSTGATVEATSSFFGITCRYRTNNTHIGTLTGGTPATLKISASIPFHGGSFFCGGENAAWTGSYKVNSPATLLVDP
jgi:hypothetical protein